MARRNWAAFYRNMRNRQERAAAEGLARPAPRITSEDDPTVLAQHPPQDTDQEQDDDDRD